MRVVPVAGTDSMLLNLSGAHAPFFTRNLVLLTDNAGHTGVGEVPGGEKIRRVLEESQPLVVGQPLAAYNAILDEVQSRFADRDREGPRPADLRPAHHHPCRHRHRVGAARSARPVSLRPGRRSSGRRPSALQRRCPRLSLLHRRPHPDRPSLSQRAGCQRRLAAPAPARKP